MKGRKKVVFELGDWVWVHFRKKRFPSQKKSKLMPRGAEPFQVLAKINDNAYKIDLLGEYNVSNTFNVFDLSLYDADNKLRGLRPKAFEKEGMMRTSRPKSNLKLQLKNLCKDWEFL